MPAPRYVHPFKLPLSWREVQWGSSIRCRMPKCFLSFRNIPVRQVFGGGEKDAVGRFGNSSVQTGRVSDRGSFGLSRLPVLLMLKVFCTARKSSKPLFVGTVPSRGIVRGSFVSVAPHAQLPFAVCVHRCSSVEILPRWRPWAAQCHYRLRAIARTLMAESVGGGAVSGEVHRTARSRCPA